MSKNAPTPESDDFNNMVNLLSVFSEATHRLAEMEANLNGEVMVIIDQYKRDYATMQKTLTEAETAVEVIATRHKEWFTVRKSLKTPYGTVKFTSSNPVVVANEELSMEIIRRDAAKHDLDPARLIRTEDKLNIRVLETLTTEQLGAFRLKRVAKENFSIVAAKVDLGKAVKEAAQGKTADKL